jgi:hypothetical protein
MDPFLSLSIWAVVNKATFVSALHRTQVTRPTIPQDRLIARSSSVRLLSLFPMMIAANLLRETWPRLAQSCQQILDTVEESVSMASKSLARLGGIPIISWAQSRLSTIWPNAMITARHFPPFKQSTFSPMVDATVSTIKALLLVTISRTA